MIIHNDTVAMGDTLNTFPTVMAMIEQTTEITQIVWTNSDVGELFPYGAYGAASLSDIPRNCQERILRISIHDFVWGRDGWVRDSDDDFARSALRHFGFSTDPLPPMAVSFPHDPSVPQYDFLLAPCVLNNAWKNMAPEFWQALADGLRLELGSSVCAIGKSTLPPEEDLRKIEYDITRFTSAQFAGANLRKYLVSVDHFWDEPLVRVAQLFANVKRCLISVDSGPSHLMRAIGGPHIELRPRAIVVKNVYDEDYNYSASQPSVDTVLQAVNDCVPQPRSSPSMRGN